MGAIPEVGLEVGFVCCVCRRGFSRCSRNRSRASIVFVAAGAQLHNFPKNRQFGLQSLHNTRKVSIMAAMTMSISSIQTSRPVALRATAQARRSVLGVQRTPVRPVLRRAEGDVPRPRPNEAIEQIDDIKEPIVDQTKSQNIQPGNISNENAERRADIGATRPPTLLGKVSGGVAMCTRLYSCA